MLPWRKLTPTENHSPRWGFPNYRCRLLLVLWTHLLSASKKNSFSLQRWVNYRYNLCCFAKYSCLEYFASFLHKWLMNLEFKYQRHFWHWFPFREICCYRRTCRASENWKPGEFFGPPKLTAGSSGYWKEVSQKASLSSPAFRVEILDYAGPSLRHFHIYHHVLTYAEWLLYWLQ